VANPLLLAVAVSNCLLLLFGTWIAARLRKMANDLAQQGDSLLRLREVLKVIANKVDHLTPFRSPQVPPPIPAAHSAGKGGFTQLLNTLSAEPASRPASQSTSLPPAPRFRLR